MPANTPATFTIGEVLNGKYRIIREIGRGAMGVVYEAVHTELGRRVAIKALADEAKANAQRLARFEREARAASAIGHPNIVEVFDLGSARSGVRYMVMELLDGSSLAGMLKLTPQLPLSLASHLMAQVLAGLAAAHKNGIVHRDLKPDNIFVSNSEERPNFVKLVDFGISKIVISPPGQSSGGQFAGTRAGTVLGTPSYMSPEQALGQTALTDHRTDIYSAGVVLYEMVCGRRPFEGVSVSEIIGAIVDGKYPRPRGLRPDIPAALEATIVRAMCRLPKDRFGSSAEMRAEIVGGTVEPGFAAALLPGGSSEPEPATSSTFDGFDGTSANSIVLDPNTSMDIPATSRGGNPVPGHFSAEDLDDPPVALARDPASADAGVPPLRQASAGEPLALDLGPTARARARDRGARAATLQPPQRRSPWLVVAAGLAIAGGVAFVALRPRRPAPVEALPPPPAPPVANQFHLLIDPPNASVEIDGKSVSARELPLDAGPPRARQVKVSAPGHLARSFSFTPTAGMKLGVRLGHILPPPSPAEPLPSPAELSLVYPEAPRPVDEINDAFAKLERYAGCLGVLGGEGTTAKHPSFLGTPRPDELARCQQAVEKAATMWPQVPGLDTAALAFMAAVHAGRDREALNRMAGTFRAEFLLTRTAWQWEELSRIGKDEGRNAGWHMRRVALASQAWARARKLGDRATEAPRTGLQESVQAMVEQMRAAKEQTSRISGTDAFIREVQALSGLARPEKRASEGATHDACRKLLAAFNALVLD